MTEIELATGCLKEGQFFVDTEKMEIDQDGKVLRFEDLESITYDSEK